MGWLDGLAKNICLDAGFKLSMQQNMSDDFECDDAERC
jgi:hypothetical protein